MGLLAVMNIGEPPGSDSSGRLERVGALNK